MKLMVCYTEILMIHLEHILCDFLLHIGGTLSMVGMALFFVIGGIRAGITVGLKGKKLFSGFLSCRNNLKTTNF